MGYARRLLCGLSTETLLVRRHPPTAGSDSKESRTATVSRVPSKLSDILHLRFWSLPPHWREVRDAVIGLDGGFPPDLEAHGGLTAWFGRGGAVATASG